jgi:hypothetical protein
VLADSQQRSVKQRGHEREQHHGDDQLDQREPAMAGAWLSAGLAAPGVFAD